MFDCLAHFEHVDAPDHFVHLAETELRHDLPHLLRDEEKEIDYVFGLALRLAVAAFSTSNGSLLLPTGRNSLRLWST